eukprot:TRINITY_DN5245_c0_g1_i2.p1 TRINITY_DN5245_c0_g1~~TRINITY_DN5245_c0_g1_i2.p1  ORF type:complete len:207 (+),score=19.34 TRINITY_DN5245_c0_g1_i2:341-961(+)
MLRQQAVSTERSPAKLSIDPTLSQRTFKADTQESSFGSTCKASTNQNFNSHSKVNCLASIYGGYSIQKSLSHKKMLLPKGINFNKARGISLKSSKVSGVQIATKPFARVFFPEDIASQNLKIEAINLSYKTNAINKEENKRTFKSFTGERKAYTQRQCDNANLLEVLERVKRIMSEHQKTENLLIKENNYLKKEIAKLRTQARVKG